MAPFLSFVALTSDAGFTSAAIAEVIECSFYLDARVTVCRVLGSHTSRGLLGAVALADAASDLVIFLIISTSWSL